MESLDVLNLDALADLLAPRIAARLSKPTEANVFNAKAAWHTTKSAAARIGFKPAYLENLRVKGEGPPYVKVGNIVRYSEAALDMWMISRSRKSTAGGK